MDCEFISDRPSYQLAIVQKGSPDWVLLGSAILGDVASVPSESVTELVGELVCASDENVAVLVLSTLSPHSFTSTRSSSSIYVLLAPSVGSQDRVRAVS